MFIINKSLQEQNDKTVSVSQFKVLINTYIFVFLHTS